MGAAFTSQLEFTHCVLPQDSPRRDAYEHSFAVMGSQDGVHPTYHSKYLEWETSVWISNMDLLWTGEERDAAVVVQLAHEQTNALLGE